MEKLRNVILRFYFDHLLSKRDDLRKKEFANDREIERVRQLLSE